MQVAGQDQHTDTLCPLGTRMLVLRSFSDFSARWHMQKVRAISHRLLAALCGCPWLFPALLYSLREDFFFTIKCVSYLTSCNVSAAADASSSHSAQLSLRVFVYNTKKDTTKAKPQKNHKKLYSWCSEFISRNCRDKMKTFRTIHGCSLSVCFVDRRIKRMTLVFCWEENMLGFFLAATEGLGYWREQAGGTCFYMFVGAM